MLLFLSESIALSDLNLWFELWKNVVENERMKERKTIIPDCIAPILPSRHLFHKKNPIDIFMTFSYLSLSLTCSGFDSKNILSSFGHWFIIMIRSIFEKFVLQFSSSKSIRFDSYFPSYPFDDFLTFQLVYVLHSIHLSLIFIFFIFLDKLGFIIFVIMIRLIIVWSKVITFLFEIICVMLFSHRQSFDFLMIRAQKN